MTLPTNIRSQAGNMAYARHLGLLLLLLAVIGLGYAGFRYFSAEVMPRSNAYNLLTLAVIAGVASFFSPCAAVPI